MTRRCSTLSLLSGSAVLVGSLCLLGVLLASAPLLAQQGIPEACATAELHTRVVELRFRPVLDGVLLVDQLLSPCGSYKVPKSMNVIIVEDDAPHLEQISEAVSSWDLPPQSVEVTVSLIAASLDSSGDEDPPIAEETREVSRTLSEVTRWTRFRRLGSASVRVMEGGEAEVDVTEHYKLMLRVSGVDVERGFVKIEPFALLRKPSKAEAASGIGTPAKILGGELDLEEGRLHLVGTPSHSRRRAIYLAFTVWPLDMSSPSPKLEGN